MTSREEAADRIHSASIHLLRRVRLEDAESGLTPARLSALSVVVYAGPLTMGALARAEGVRPPTTTRIVEALVVAGLVRKEAASGDKRAVRLHATPAGRELLERARGRRLATLRGLLDRLTADEVETIAEAARLVERALEGGQAGSENASSPSRR